MMTQTGQVVTLKVAKQGAIFHGLATLLTQTQQPPVVSWSKFNNLIVIVTNLIVIVTNLIGIVTNLIVIVANLIVIVANLIVIVT